MQLDASDLKILEALEDDVRQTMKQLAKTVGMNRTTVGYRLNKLVSNGILNFACLVKAEVLNYQVSLGIGVNVVPGKIDVVAKQLATLPDIKIVTLVAGRYAIYAWALLKDRQDMTRFISEELMQVQGITATETMFMHSWMEESWRHFKHRSLPSSETTTFQTNELDMAIIKALRQDPRQTITDLAQASGCSKPVARERMERLLDNGVIRLVSVVDPRALGYAIEAMILVKTDPEHTYTVAHAASIHPIARQVHLITGNWQVLISAQFEDSSHMHKYLSEILAVIPGVSEFEVIQKVKILRYAMNFVDIV